MAGDWIKMRTDLYRDPKVIIMADRLLSDSMEGNARNALRNVTRNAVVGALVSIWGIARVQGRRDDGDLILENATIDVLDDIAELPGIGRAMEYVGWIRQEGKTLEFPRFFEKHNADYERQREGNRERQRRFRAKNSDVDGNALRNVTRNGCNAGEREIEIEVNTNSPPTPPKGEDEQFNQFWEVFPRGRKQGKDGARRAWKKAIKTTDPKIIIQAAREYADSPVGKGRYVKGPAPWLKQGCWADDRQAWQRCDSEKPSGQGTRFAGLAEFVQRGEQNEQA